MRMSKKYRQNYVQKATFFASLAIVVKYLRWLIELRLWVKNVGVNLI